MSDYLGLEKLSGINMNVHNRLKLSKLPRHTEKDIFIINSNLDLQREGGVNLFQCYIILVSRQNKFNKFVNW